MFMGHLVVFHICHFLVLVFTTVTQEVLGRCVTVCVCVCISLWMDVCMWRGAQIPGARCHKILKVA